MLSRLAILALLAFTVVLGADKDEKKTPMQERVEKARKDLNVYMFSSPDYPAMFGIIAGISIVLIVAVAFIVGGLLSMEPAKDSIIYRMTNTRLKKD